MNRTNDRRYAMYRAFVYVTLRATGLPFDPRHCERVIREFHRRRRKPALCAEYILFGCQGWFKYLNPRYWDFRLCVADLAR